MSSAPPPGPRAALRRQHLPSSRPSAQAPPARLPSRKPRGGRLGPARFGASAVNDVPDGLTCWPRPARRSVTWLINDVASASGRDLESLRATLKRHWHCCPDGATLKRHWHSFSGPCTRRRRGPAVAARAGPASRAAPPDPPPAAPPGPADPVSRPVRTPLRPLCRTNAGS